MDTLLDSTLRRDAQLLRFGTYLKSEYITPTMQQLSRDIPKLLVGIDELNKAEKNKVAREIRKIVQAQMGDMFDSITDELHELTAEEGEFIYELYDDFVDSELQPLVAATAISYADNAVMVLESQGTFKTGVWADFVKGNIDTAAGLVDGVVSKGFRDGATLQEMTQQLRGTYNRGSKSYNGGVLNKQNARRAETLARTGVSHYSNRARDRFADKNSDILGESVFFATLDNRTTTTCMGFHTNRYKNDDPAKPTLPLHYNERSVYLFAGKGIDPLEGTRPIVGGHNSSQAAKDFEAKQSRTDRKVTYKGRKDSDIFRVEQVSAKVSSQEWLERQPMYFIESSLGKTRAKLFKEGGLKIDKFTDLQGNPLTLEELRATAAGERAFRRIE